MSIAVRLNLLSVSAYPMGSRIFGINPPAIDRWAYLTPTCQYFSLLNPGVHGQEFTWSRAVYQSSEPVC